MFRCLPVEAPAARPGGCLCHGSAFARLTARLGQRVSRRGFVIGTAAAAAATLALGPGNGSARVPAAPAAPVAFTNLRLFDGPSGALRDGLRVVVEGPRIRAAEPAGQPLAPGVRAIDCGGRTLMPGLIDAHWHAMLAAVPLQVVMTADAGYLTLLAAQEAERTLLRGFTSVRDLAGPSFGLKRAIDGGVVPGPRIWPSGAMISQTSGHGDFRQPHEVPAAPAAPLSRGDQFGAGAIADGVGEVLKGAREQLMLGASQLKLAAGGGIASPHDPIDASQYTEAEFRAAVDAAENWGTYVAVHAYTPRAIRTAVRAGVRCIEHGQLLDEETARILADRGVWLSLQPFLDDADAPRFPEGSPNRAKQLQMTRGTDAAYDLAKRHDLKTAWGTDVLFDARLAARQGAMLAKMARWYSPPEALRMATGTNAELLALSGCSCGVPSAPTSSSMIRDRIVSPAHNPGPGHSPPASGRSLVACPRAKRSRARATGSGRAARQAARWISAARPRISVPPPSEPSTSSSARPMRENSSSSSSSASRAWPASISASTWSSRSSTPRAQPPASPCPMKRPPPAVRSAPARRATRENRPSRAGVVRATAASDHCRRFATASLPPSLPGPAARSSVPGTAPAPRRRRAGIGRRFGCSRTS